MKTLFIRVAALAAALLLAACGNSEANKLRGEFLKGCMSGGTDKSTCSCAYDKIEEKYSVQDIKRFNANPDRVPERFVRDMMNGMLMCTGQPTLPEPTATAPARQEQAASSDNTPPAAVQRDGVSLPAQLPAGSEDYTKFDTGEPVKLAPGAYDFPPEAAEVPPSN